MSQPVKVYYVENQITKEIRKFSLENDVAGNFEYVATKIRRTFPDFLTKDIQIFWKDSENDYVTISSDEELHEALSNIFLNDGLLKLYVKAKTSDKDNCKSHPCSNSEKCRRVPFGRRGPFRGIGSCGFGGSFPFSGMFHPFANFYYPQNQASEEKKEKSDKKPKDGEDSKSSNGGCSKEECSDMIEMLATTFGFDPEVAKLHFTSFCNDLKNSHEDEQREETEKSNLDKKADPDATDENCETKPNKEDLPEEDKDIVTLLTKTFGLNPEMIKIHFNVSDDLKRNQKEGEAKDNTEEEKKSDVPNEEPSNPDTEKEKTSSTKTKEEMPIQNPADENKNDKTSNKNGQFKNELESMVAHFSEQFGLNEEAKENIQGGLNTLLQGIFHPPLFQSQNSTSNEKDSQTKQADDEEPRKPDDFIFVDEEKEGEKSLTEDENYQQRLDKALKQMENMGFDNEGGWLEQLLISKNVSIGRVLDALNPSN